MPVFLNKQAQLSTEDANETRFVTSIRCLVVVANGQLKNWRALNNIIPNVQMQYIGDYVKTVCSILNAFHPARLNNIEDNNVIALQVLGLVKTPNYLNKQLKKMAGKKKSDLDLVK
ncbi:DDE Tnp4 domain-containing protein [Trichonephila clavipes]|nr:DDE Tnp4 domain-containing protein [Trichonephila clavipes]